MDLTELVRYCEGRGRALSLAQIDQFNAFGDALYEQNKVMNLTRVPYAECATRHFVDSLVVSDYVPENQSLLDIGTGPGFPAWPLAVWRPDLTITAMDGSAKSLNFLRKFPLKNLSTVQGRAEESAHREGYQVVTGRAVAPFAVQCEISVPLVEVGGLFVALRTQHEVAGIESFPYEKLGCVLERIVEVNLQGIPGHRVFPIVRKVSPTPNLWPRRWAEIKAKPLA